MFRTVTRYQEVDDSFKKKNIVGREDAEMSFLLNLKKKKSCTKFFLITCYGKKGPELFHISS